MGSIFEAIFSFILTIILKTLLWMVLVPLGCILMTPVILLRARSGSGIYREKVILGYKKVLLWFLDSLLNPGF